MSIWSNREVAHVSTYPSHSRPPSHRLHLSATSSTTSLRSSNSLTCILKMFWNFPMRRASSCCAATCAVRSAMNAITASGSALWSRIMSLPASARRSLAALDTALTPCSSSEVNSVTLSSRAASTSSSSVLRMLKSTLSVWNAAASISDTGNLNSPIRSYRFCVSTASVSSTASASRRISSAKDICATKSSALLSLALSCVVESCTRAMNC
mmetsp:Transcript_14319/g.34889  ORF Transcript_14319/g.34889 Transcript_14319/m.34889 type:complete len:211 (-) Transcript_14319:1010-1642(-)